ncbi:1-aminocyclopropane-1-carboxylate deaminase [Campylobacter sp. MIT 12-8780]|uniref:1-aminocyclopropane-1-carboxylate deaminase/D-cysteine desulfhydrase n=1 Tax=Campylobacter sp. MIT 12-8780 TaxID=2202200 RepID=UPI00115F55BF|nr:1-aminocyclopropane-1-carboxylate deaminase/D-cysteine desulfhydrase [Campylobacter sp. MIT 12-8780]TQR42989.1 1-aminocyclopropane-1-carboxylate deaminase [Campylobacter sp. MIT 12-8780]
MQDSIIQKITLEGFEFYVKRDDTLGLINGNKARKLYYFLQNKALYKPRTRFVSFGSTQSNALAALSDFTKQNDFKLLFITPKISNFLKENPQGNFAYALKNQACIIENTSNLSLEQKALSLLEKDDVFIPCGVACKEAELGLQKLAEELKRQSECLGLEFDLFLPSGTGTSAAFLAKHSCFKVFSCACVGDKAYVKAQITKLIPHYDFSNLFFLEPPLKFHFAKPQKELLSIYHKALKQCKIEFDLLYDSVALLTLLAYQKAFTKPVLYIHQGGLLGNKSMLERYKHKFGSF